MSPVERDDLRLRIAAEDLCEILIRLRREHEELYELLVDKQQALIDVQLEAIDLCRKQEEETLHRVIDQEKERLLVTEEIGDLLGVDEPAALRVSEILPHVDEGLAHRLADHRDSLREVALRMARQNAVNRALIEHSVGHVKVFLSKLVNEELLANTYDDHGTRADGGDRSFLMDRRG